MNTASTRQPPAGGPGDASGQDELLRDLRRGERDGFVRYFRLYRTPVYGLALRLLRDEQAAVAATAEALSAAFRRVILDDGTSDLQTLTYRCAFDACAAHDGAAAGTAQAAGAVAEEVEPARTRRRSLASDTGDRFETSLDALDLQQRAALLLHDVQGLSAAQLAVVFSTSAEAAAALLFRARVEFRGAFHVRSAHVRGGTCRQAEQTVAGTVGLGLPSGELERLRGHAAYCKP
jgi:RNA polymerase sigma-70 factor (ECF subfamily)